MKTQPTSVTSTNVILLNTSHTHIGLAFRHQVSVLGDTSSKISGYGIRPEFLSDLSVPGDQLSCLTRNSNETIPWKSALRLCPACSLCESWKLFHTVIASASSRSCFSPFKEQPQHFGAATDANHYTTTQG